MNGVVFNLHDITAQEFDDFNRAMQEGDVPGQARGLARMVEACPSEWGDPKDPQTYLKLKFFDEFKPLRQAFMDEVNGKN